MASHAQAEQFIKDSGTAYTESQYGFYQEMILPFVEEKVAKTGITQFPAQAGKASWVLREELAEAAAHVLTSEGHQNKTYVLTNSEATSFAGITQNLSRQLGKSIRYQFLA